MNSTVIPEPDGSPLSFDQWYEMFRQQGLGHLEARWAAAGAVGHTDPDALLREDG